ncbi:Uncharacterised protein [Sphingobacterium spiritivorum]|uniref:Uncharacterized protein n=1 Tax=Sphingobacterium spiritivorum TaxID=258 RepID=A0A380CRP7_SPHSI|nr:Uncharacterised protein [Sphingobacterium spiritivorum]
MLSNNGSEKNGDILLLLSTAVTLWRHKRTLAPDKYQGLNFVNSLLFKDRSRFIGGEVKSDISMVLYFTAGTDTNRCANTVEAQVYACARQIPGVKLC